MFFIVTPRTRDQILCEVGGIYWLTTCLAACVPAHAVQCGRRVIRHWPKNAVPLFDRIDILETMFGTCSINIFRRIRYFVEVIHCLRRGSIVSRDRQRVWRGRIPGGCQRPGTTRIGLTVELIKNAIEMHY